MAAPNATAALATEAAPLPVVAAVPTLVPTLVPALVPVPAPVATPTPAPAHAALTAYASEPAVLARIDDLASPANPPVPVAGRSTALGHAVIALGPALPPGSVPDAASAAEETIAIWSLDLDGARTGGCVLPVAALHTDPEAARQVLALVDGRAIVTAAPKPVRRLLTRAVLTAGVARPRIDWPVLNLGACIREVARTRARYVTAIDQRRARRGRSADSEPAFSWSLEDVLTSAGGGALVDTVGVYAPRHTVPAAGQALRLTRLLVRTIAAWRETELAKAHRPHLRQLFGPPRPLPARWHGAVQNAGARPIGG